jgi:ABC-2 type transport system permease protein
MAIGFLFMNMLYLASQTASMLVEDKKKKLFFRIFTGPVTTRRYMLNNIISFYLVMIIQIAVLMLAMFGIYGMFYGESLLNMMIVFAVFGLLAVSFGVFIGTYSKTPSVASTMSSIIIVPLSMLGGFFWDIQLMPDFLQRISSFLPTSWGIGAAEKLLQGMGLADVVNNIAVLLLFTTGFFILGALKKADISK